MNRGNYFFDRYRVPNTEKVTTLCSDLTLWRANRAKPELFHRASHRGPVRRLLGKVFHRLVHPFPH